MLYIGSLTLNQIPFNFAKRVQIYKDNYIWVGLNDQKQYKPIDFSRCWKKKMSDIPAVLWTWKCLHLPQKCVACLQLLKLPWGRNSFTQESYQSIKKAGKPIHSVYPFNIFIECFLCARYQREKYLIMNC